MDLNGAVLEGIETDKWIQFNEHTQVQYASPGKISDTVVKQVEKLKPDILFIVGLFSWHFNIVPMLFCKGPKKILSTRGMLHPGAFHATDEDERLFISKYFGKSAQVYVAGNFPNKIGPLTVVDKKPGNLRLVSIGIISQMKNILEVLITLSKCTGTIDYAIYGPVKDEDYWGKCKEAIKAFPANVEVTYHKEITPSQVKDALEAGHVFILPSKSENFGHAIFEALSAARPVITSFNTPWKELRESGAGVNVDVAKEGDLAKAIDLFVNMDGE